MLQIQAKLFEHIVTESIYFSAHLMGLRAQYVVRRVTTTEALLSPDLLGKVYFAVSISGWILKILHCTSEPHPCWSVFNLWPSICRVAKNSHHFVVRSRQHLLFFWLLQWVSDTHDDVMCLFAAPLSCADWEFTAEGWLSGLLCCWLMVMSVKAGWRSLTLRLSW